MTTMLKQRQRPEAPLKEVLGQQEAPEELKVAKTTIHVGKEEGIEQDTVDEETSSLFRPTDEQVELINQYTRSPKTADELAVFPTHACNTLWDRDDDRFVQQTLTDFDSMEAPFSPLGKSFLIGHNHTSLPVGRIFDKSVESLGEGESYLRTWQYIPNTDQYKAYLENLDFGIFWAVSVGVMLTGAQCSACNDNWSWNPWFCVNGHEKGYHYDLSVDEEDRWGYPVPVEDGAGDESKAVFCGREFVGGRDFYELSQVYLGAQYFAEVTDKVPALKSVDAGSQLTLRREEVKALEPKDDRFAEALKNHIPMGLTPDGNVAWQDADDLVWFYDVSRGSYASLGRADSDWASGIRMLTEDPEPTGFDPDGGDQTKMGQDDKEIDQVSKTKLIDAVNTAKLPTTVLERIAEAEDDKAAETLCTTFSELLADADARKAEMKAELNKAKELGELGEAYLKTLRQDVIDMYVKSHQDPQDPQKVNTDTVVKLVDACGSNVQLLKSLLDDYKRQVEARFPGTVRRSVHPDDPHKGKGADGEHAVGEDARATGASRLHG